MLNCYEEVWKRASAWQKRFQVCGQLKGKEHVLSFSSDLAADALAHNRQTLNSFSPSKLKNLPKLHLDRKGWDCSCWQQLTFKASYNMKLHPKNNIPLSNLNPTHQTFRKCYFHKIFFRKETISWTLILFTLTCMLKFNVMCISPHSIRKVLFPQNYYIPSCMIYKNNAYLKHLNLRCSCRNI